MQSWSAGRERTSQVDLAPPPARAKQPSLVKGPNPDDRLCDRHVSDDRCRRVQWACPGRDHPLRRLREPGRPLIGPASPTRTSTERTCPSIQWTPSVATQRQVIEITSTAQMARQMRRGNACATRLHAIRLVTRRSPPRSSTPTPTHSINGTTHEQQAEILQARRTRRSDIPDDSRTVPAHPVRRIQRGADGTPRSAARTLRRETPRHRDDEQPLPPTRDRRGRRSSHWLRA